MLVSLFSPVYKQYEVGNKVYYQVVVPVGLHWRFASVVVKLRKTGVVVDFYTVFFSIKVPEILLPASEMPGLKRGICRWRKKN